MQPTKKGGEETRRPFLILHYQLHIMIFTIRKVIHCVCVQSTLVKHIMSFVIRKVKRCGFTTVNNSLIRNTDLDYNERVAIIIVMSLPETKPNGEPFEYCVEGFAKIMGVAYSTAQKVLVSLDKKGYLYREWERIAGTYKRMEYVFYEDKRDNPYYSDAGSDSADAWVKEDFTDYPQDKPYMLGYTVFDNKTLRNIDLKPVERLVWWGGLSLPKHKNNGELFEINIDSLSKMLTLNHSTVQKSLSVLIKKGYVVRTRYRTSNGGNKFIYEFYQYGSDEEAAENLSNQPICTNTDISKNDKTVDCITVERITVEQIQKNEICKEINNKRNNIDNNSNTAVISNLKYREGKEEPSEMLSTISNDNAALVEEMKSIICKTFNKSPDELNGIELSMIDEWIRCGADEDILNLAVEDSLFKKNFSVKDIDYRIMTWLRAGAQTAADCQKMIDAAHQRNLEEFKKRNSNTTVTVMPRKNEAIKVIMTGSPYAGLMMLLSGRTYETLNPDEIVKYIVPFYKMEWEGKWIALELLKKLDATPDFLRRMVTDEKLLSVLSDIKAFA